MGRIKQGILGGFSGKVGAVVGSSWKGIAVMKAKPLSVANPKTAGQVAQRGLFSAASKIASLILASIVKPLNDKFAQRQSGYNAFVSRNINFVGTLPFTTPELITISKGSLLGIENFACTSSEAAGTVVCTWDDNSGQGKALATDLFAVQVWNVDTGVSYISTITVDDRAELSATDASALLIEGDDIAVCACYISVDGSVISTGQVALITVGA